VRASTVRTKVSLAGAWKQLRWSSNYRQVCSRRTFQQWQKPGGCTCWVGDVMVRAVDFAQRNGDVTTLWLLLSWYLLLWAILFMGMPYKAGWLWYTVSKKCIWYSWRCNVLTCYKYKISSNSTWLDSTRLDTFDVSSPCNLAVSS